MLRLKLDAIDLYNEEINEFITKDEVVLELEHSLVSVSKWEAKFEVPFLSNKDKTREETLAYIQCMILNPDFDEDIGFRITETHLKKINDYITAKNTATWFNENPNQPKSREIITAEIIYYWMIALNIPQEYETWHLSRLFTLIKVVNEKSQQAANGNKKKPMTRSDLASRRALNEARKKQLGTSG